MKHYFLNRAVRDAMGTNEPAVKAAIAIIANNAFNIAAEPEGIWKREGGVRVNGRQIAIKKDIVIDDFGPHTLDETAEEKATVDAIMAIAEKIEKYGIEPVRTTYGECTIGDPLRCLIAGP